MAGAKRLNYILNFNLWFSLLKTLFYICQEPDRTMSIIGVLTNIVDHIYYPVEKICWLAEHRLLHVQNPGRWDVISAVFYVSSIYLNLMRYVY